MNTKLQSKFLGSMWPWVICIVGALFYSYEYFLRILPSVMTSNLMHAYRIDATALGAMVAFYYYAYVAMQIPVGVLMDKYGPRRLLAIACLLCAGGTYFFGSSEMLLVAQIGRFVMGFGSAFAFVGVLKLATIWLPPNRFAMIAGLTAALGTIGGITGDVSLTALVGRIGWRETVMLFAVIGVILAAFIWLIIRDQVKEPPLDIRKMQVLRSDQPNLWSGILRIIGNPQMWVVGLIGCLMYLPSSAFAELWGIPFFQAVYHYSSVQAANANAVLFVGFLIGGPLLGFVSDYLRRRRLLLLIGSIVAAALFFILVKFPVFPPAVVFAIVFFIGISYGAQVVVFALGRELCAPSLSGTAIAVTNMLVMIGGMIFQPLVGYLLDHFSGGKILGSEHIYSASDYQSALMALPVCLVVSIFLTFFVKETHGEMLVREEDNESDLLPEANH